MSICRNLKVVICLGLALAASPMPMAADPNAIELANPTTYQFRIVMKVSAEKNQLTRVTSTCPLPAEWREQRAKLIRETLPPGTKSREQTIQGTGKLWIVSCPKLAAGRTLTWERVYEIKRFHVAGRWDGKSLRLPKAKTDETRAALGESPGIDPVDDEIRRLAEELAKPGQTPFDFARAAADWVQKNVTYQLGEYRGAKFALEQRLGDCEDLSALFIALCRAREIPARTVWVEGHAYPEFYLEEENKGDWIPVQLHGPEDFGSISETRPILQKGDRYRDSTTRRMVRYLPQQAVCYGGQASLSVLRTSLTPDSTNSRFRGSIRE
jgi:hypothetical protein